MGGQAKGRREFYDIGGSRRKCCDIRVAGSLKEIAIGRDYSHDGVSVRAMTSCNDDNENRRRWAD